MIKALGGIRKIIRLENRRKVILFKVKIMTIEVAEKPTENKCFKVDPRKIDKNLFFEEREDPRQEWTRRIILEAFEELEKNPEKYAKPFNTMIPKKTWKVNTIEELEKKARSLGNHMADWVEQALEWAQRISNGESWEDVCNKPDTANWHRLVIWENGYVRRVGGSRKSNNNYPASEVRDFYTSSCMLNDSVPSIVL